MELGVWPTLLGLFFSFQAVCSLAQQAAANDEDPGNFPAAVTNIAAPQLRRAYSRVVGLAAITLEVQEAVNITHSIVEGPSSATSGCPLASADLSKSSIPPAGVKAVGRSSGPPLHQ